MRKRVKAGRSSLVEKVVRRARKPKLTPLDMDKVMEALKQWATCPCEECEESRSAKGAYTKEVSR